MYCHRFSFFFVDEIKLAQPYLFLILLMTRSARERANKQRFIPSWYSIFLLLLSLLLFFPSFTTTHFIINIYTFLATEVRRMNAINKEIFIQVLPLSAEKWKTFLLLQAHGMWKVQWQEFIKFCENEMQKWCDGLCSIMVLYTKTNPHTHEQYRIRWCTTVWFTEPRAYNLWPVTLIVLCTSYCQSQKQFVHNKMPTKFWCFQFYSHFIDRTHGNGGLLLNQSPWYWRHGLHYRHCTQFDIPFIVVNVVGINVTGKLLI